LASGLSTEEARRELNKLRQYLRTLRPDAAAAALTAFLAERTDARSGLDFKISASGQLNEAPSLRVWLLDCLGEIDRDAAAEYAKTILSHPSSADEWAVSLRDYALVRTSPEDVAFIQARVRELISNPAWQTKPSAGFLEAFDTIVYTKATMLTRDLAQLVSARENRVVAHAAYLTLDRLVIEEPQKVLSQLAADPSLMKGREQTRANYFARADVRDPQQRALLETYLLDPSRTAEELKTFAGVFPNANLMISTNLLTRTGTPTQNDIVTEDREALAIVVGWIADPRFARIEDHLKQVHSRLENFVRQAEADVRR
jgi:hypothetical protein